MATHMICQIAAHLGAAFQPYVAAILPKFLPLISLSHATYTDLRAYAVESLHHVRNVTYHVSEWRCLHISCDSLSHLRLLDARRSSQIVTVN